MTPLTLSRQIGRNLMRAVLVKGGKGPVENLYISHIPIPVTGPGQVLVKVKTFGINRMDIAQREGHYQPPAGCTPVLGVEFAGHIAELGPDVSGGWCEGDETIGLAGGGAYAEYVVLHHKHIVKKPTHLSWVQAASSGNFSDGHTVTATASTQEKLNWILSIPKGPTHAVNYKTQDFSKEVQAITNGKGVDVLVDVVGQSHWHKNMASLAADGRMVIAALLSGQFVSSVDLAPIKTKRLHIQGTTLRSRSPEYQSELIARFNRELLGKITGSDEDGPLYTYIHKVYPWTEIQAAHREMEEDKHRGKIIVEVV